MKPLNISLLLLAAALLLAACNAELSAPTDLRCEQAIAPNSVDVAQPRLSWVNDVVDPQIKNQEQTAYQIRVASSQKQLSRPDLWKSKKIKSSQSHLVKYEGSPLASGVDCWWQVRVWDAKGRASDWSAPARWTTGIMDQSEWVAKWIGAPWQAEEADGATFKDMRHFPFRNRDAVEENTDKPAPMFRKEFTLDRVPVSAKAFVTGLGYFELYANGQKVGDDCLVPNFTNYTHREGLDKHWLGIEANFVGYRVMYLVYDLTDYLEQGANALGMLVGNGWYNIQKASWPAAFGSPRMICQVRLKYDDGSEETIVSDESWKVAQSAITLNDEYRGEIFDARLDTEGWNKPGFDDSAWQNAVLRNAPDGRLVASAAPLDRVTKQLSPVSITKVDEGYEVDFGEEISGWVRLRNLSGNSGDTLRIHYVIDQPVGDEVYVFSDKPCVDYAPKFAWYVFRKAIVSGVESLEKENLIAEIVNTHVEEAVEFATSNDLFNQIVDIWKRTQLDNMHGGIASDCPHREKSPYTGDGQVACEMVMTTFDAAAFYNKWIGDMRDSQDSISGYVPNGAPWQPRCGGGVAWGAAMNIMPWEYYRHYGDTEYLALNYAPMKEQLRYMQGWETADGTMLSQLESTSAKGKGPNYWFNLGDWSMPAGLPDQELVHTFYYWMCADLTAKAAAVVGTPDEATEYAAKAAAIKKAFIKKFYNPQTKSFGEFGSNVFALYMGVPEQIKADVIENLRAELQDKNNSHLNTGIFGTRYLFEVLAHNGLNDLAYDIMNQRDMPSFGYWIEQGSTTTWEDWDGHSSHNHPMFGGGLVWLYDCLAGINVDESAPAYRHVVIAPVIASELENVQCTMKTPYGKVTSRIAHSGGHGTLEVTIPVGSTATVHVPGDATPHDIAQGTYTFSF